MSESIIIKVHEDLTNKFWMENQPDSARARPLLNVDNYDVEANLHTPTNKSLTKEKELAESFLELQRLSIRIQLIINDICFKMMKKN